MIAVLILSVQEHQSLYKGAVKKDLEALTINMAEDLLPIVATNSDDFEITTTLLRLDAYQNIVIAAVYNTNWEIVSIYHGRAKQMSKQDLAASLESIIENKSVGTFDKQDQLIAIKTIGETSFPQGYLMIINDTKSVLNESLSSLLANVVPWVVGIIVVLLIILLNLQNRMLRPLDTLAGLAKVVKETKDYGLRFQSDGKREIKRLGADFNSMMETIEYETAKNLQITKRLKDQQKAMERLANFDTLTGLPNRQFFMQTLRLELSKAKREQVNSVLMYLDLDGFKEVNDTYGHEVGDALLVQVAKKIKSYIREGDIAARLGGDEFLILLHNEPNQYFLTEIANRIVNGLSRPFYVQEWELNVSVSVGIAKAKDSNFNLSDFISNADIAMYRSKLAGKGVYTSFLPEMMEDNRRKLMIANAIIPALENHYFEVHYQAKVDLNEEVVGFEALVRWNDPDLGFVSPSEFIPIAESSGKVHQLTEWVLTQTFKDTPELVKTFGKHIKVSINLSALDIKRLTLLELIKELVKQNGVEPDFIEFEVTESAYLENFEDADKFLGALKEAGFSIALDDFGTGYSSLGYLTKMPINTLKIDKQFVDQLEISEQSTLVTTTIIQMAKQLNLTICAEGVETIQQKDFLIANHCQHLQGFLFSKPAKLTDVLQKVFL